jgi:hypothetical protein
MTYFIDVFNNIIEINKSRKLLNLYFQNQKHDCFFYQQCSEISVAHNVATRRFFPDDGVSAKKSHR